MKNLTGEEYYKSVFKFKSLISLEDQTDYRDYLYKYAYNYQDAIEYLTLVQQTNYEDSLRASYLVFRINDMALQCLALSIRRMTDKIGERSVVSLLNKLINYPTKQHDLSMLEEINGHFNTYNDKRVAHQDKNGILEIIGSYPTEEVVLSDLKNLKLLYYRISKHICTSCININEHKVNFKDEINRLIS
jgi:hypothetical protein